MEYESLPIWAIRIWIAKVFGGNMFRVEERIREIVKIAGAEAESPKCQWCGDTHVVLNPKTQNALPCPYCQLLGGGCVDMGAYRPFGTEG